MEDVLKLLEEIRAENIMKANTPLFNISNNFENLLKFLEKEDFAIIVNQDRKLEGLVTKDELIVKDLNVHIPTLLKIIENTKAFNIDKEYLSEFLNKIKNISLKDIMNPHPITLRANAKLREIISEIFSHPELIAIPVINDYKQVIGVITRNDLLRFLEEKLFVQFGGSDKKHYETSALQFRMRENLSKLISNLLKEFVFVKKEKEKIWIPIMIFIFALGFLTAILWIIRLWKFW
jgi:Mg/Co/Ni transporter MgtE